MPIYSSDNFLQETQIAISELVKSFKLYWFYSESHPATLELIHAIYKKIHNILEEGPLKLNLSTNEVYLGAVALDSKNKNVMEFCRHLNHRRIYSITLIPELTEEEMFKLVGILSMDPKQIRRLGGVRKQLLEQTLIHVDITEYNYENEDINSDSINSPEDYDPLLAMTEEDMRIIQDYLRGVTNDLSKELEELLKEILSNPIRITELINQTISVNDTIHDHDEVILNLQKIHVRIYQWLNKLELKEKNLLVRKLAAGLLHQRPEVGIDILTHRERLNPEQNKCIILITESMSDEELLDLITRNMNKVETPEEIHPLMIKLPIGSSRIIRLTQKYVVLIEQRKKVEQDQREMLKLQERFYEQDHSKVLSDILGTILEIMETDYQITIHQDISEILEKSIIELVSFRKYDAILDISQTMNGILNGDNGHLIEIQSLANSLKLKLASESNIQNLISDLESASTQDEEKLVSILSFLGPPVVGQIVTIFSLSTRFILRRPLSRVLIRIGDNGVEELTNHILISTEDIAKELISIMGQIGSPKAMDELKNLYQQISSVLRSQVVLVLSDHKTIPNREWLTKVIRAETDSAVQVACLEGLCKIGDRESIDLLKEYALRVFMKKESERILQNRAIQILGKLNVTEVAPDLIKIFNQSRWIPSKKRDQMRIVIAQTLWKMENENAKNTVMKGCRDFRGSVRRMCRGLVMSSKSSDSHG